jgi:DNA-binding transcriptional ArsR family regulator
MKIDATPRTPLDDAQAARLAALCKALAHPARVRIVEHLRAVDGCVCGEIVTVMGLAQSTVSQHLKILKEAGIVRGTLDGPRTCYCLDPEGLAAWFDLAEALAKGDGR